MHCSSQHSRFLRQRTETPYWLCAATLCGPAQPLTASEHCKGSFGPAGGAHCAAHDSVRPAGCPAEQAEQPAGKPRQTSPCCSQRLRASLWTSCAKPDKLSGLQHSPASSSPAEDSEQPECWPSQAQGAVRPTRPFNATQLCPARLRTQSSLRAGRARPEELAPSRGLQAPSPACRMPISGPTSAMSSSSVATSAGNFLHVHKVCQAETRLKSLYQADHCLSAGCPSQGPPPPCPAAASPPRPGTSCRR